MSGCTSGVSKATINSEKCKSFFSLQTEQSVAKPHSHRRESELGNLGNKNHLIQSLDPRLLLATIASRFQRNTGFSRSTEIAGCPAKINYERSGEGIVYELSICEFTNPKHKQWIDSRRFRSNRPTNRSLWPSHSDRETTIGACLQSSRQTTETHDASGGITWGFDRPVQPSACFFSCW